MSRLTVESERLPTDSEVLDFLFLEVFRGLKWEDLSDMLVPRDANGEYDVKRRFIEDHDFRERIHEAMADRRASCASGEDEGSSGGAPG